MRQIQDMLRDALGRDEVLRKAKAQSFLRRWPEVVGEPIAQRSWPDRYQTGVVWVAVSGSAWVQELRMKKETFLQRLREMSGDNDLFKDIRFGVRPFVVPDPVCEEPAPPELPDYEGLSIREIAARRLAKRRRERGV